MERRVVVTGMGALTPIGNDVNVFWENAKKGTNGIGPITYFDTTELKSKLGGELKGFEYPNYKEGKRMDRFCQYGMTAAKEAMDDSGLVSGENIAPERLGVFVGSGIGGVNTLENEVRKAQEKGVKRASALLVPMVIGNIGAGNIAIAMNAKGACLDIVTACATGTNAIGEAMRSIRHGYADAIIAGSAEASFSEVCFSGFVNMTATSTSIDINRASIPFDKERNGFVMGEGAGILILEELNHALERGAKIYAEVVGYATTCDAYHMTSPAPEGEGAARCMELALEDAKLAPEQIGYINAHGTGTPPNDLCETQAIKTAFGEHAYKMPISSTKSMIGHLLGAAGSVESVICIKAMEEGFVPPTINLEVPDEALDLDYVPHVGREVALEYTMSNSLGFGGHNGCLIFKKWEA